MFNNNIKKYFATDTNLVSVAKYFVVVRHMIDQVVGLCNRNILKILITSYFKTRVPINYDNTV